MKIGLLSDTHGWLDSQVFRYFKDCEEIWHAGDIGSIDIIEQLEAFKPLRAVYGNIDGQDIRARCPENQHFMCAGMHIWITHIGGKPPRYTPTVLAGLQQQVPDILVCGHSHILQVMHDAEHPPLLYLNSGAAGQYGFHQMRTLLRFEVKEGKVSNVQAIKLGPRSSIRLQNKTDEAL